MPWAKNTYERTIKVYKDIIGDYFLEHQKDIDMIAKELLIRGEILKHSFTKRQISIIMFIMTFSYNYGKETAYIPKVGDFALAGVGPSKIKSELEKLMKLKVIDRDIDRKLYWIQEPRFWEAPYNPSYNDDRSRDLFMKNLEDAGIDVSPIIRKLREIEY